MADFVFGNLGPCEITFGSTTLTGNHSVEVRSVDLTAEHHEASYGSDAKDETLTGRSVEVDVTVVEASITELQAILPGSTKTANELMFNSPVGTTLRSIADKLTIKKIIGGVASSTATEWLTFFVAAPKSDLTLGFDDGGTDREVKVTFKCFRALSVPSGETYAIGDSHAIGYGETS
ncbi:hypothetical protein LCGC14_2296170 [marine sediment metagenome]|uniref:Uncharacterized protein n=1 Tax=marine sediment metagenome TaxID=412755 RepID=A0A0F9CPU0_9ZZZZ